MTIIGVRHNVEMGHRLSLRPDSKCFHLHGHSWWVELEIEGPKDAVEGMVLEFGAVKKVLRSWLDTNFDHHMVLNSRDPLVRLTSELDTAEKSFTKEWGIVPVDFDPTVENLAYFFWHYFKIDNPLRLMNPGMYHYCVTLREGGVNMARFGDIR